MFDLRSVKVIVLAALAMLLAFTMPSFSSATFTASSTTTMTVTSASDFVPPTVNITVDKPWWLNTWNVNATSVDNAGGTGVESITFQTRLGNGEWIDRRTVATSRAATWSWDPREQESAYYDVRAIATDKAGNKGSSAPARELIVNGLAVVLTPPSSVVRGKVQLTSRLYNNVRLDFGQAIQYRKLGNTTWLDVGSSGWLVNPYTTTWDTTDLLDGTYELQAQRRTVVGSDRDSVITTVTVDNGPSRINLADEDSTVAEPAPRSSAAAPEGTERPGPTRAQPAHPAETTPETSDPVEPAPVETDPADTVIEDGPKDETVVEPTPEEPPAAPGEEEDETAPGDDEALEAAELRGVSISVADGGNGAGSLNQADSFTFTYSGEIDPTTVLAGWSGEATAVSVRLRDGQLFGGAQDDTLDIRSGDLPVELGQVHIGADVIDNDQQILLPATVVAQTVTVDGALLSTVTVTLGAVVDEAEVLRPTTTAPALTWTPSAAVTTTTGRPCMTEAVTQFAGETF